jgi:hypothetical protein
MKAVLANSVRRQASAPRRQEGDMKGIIMRRAAGA